jgi:hypothetical protein
VLIWICQLQHDLDLSNATKKVGKMMMNQWTVDLEPIFRESMFFASGITG